jgi:hypothetical protein
MWRAEILQGLAMMDKRRNWLIKNNFSASQLYLEIRVSTI